MLTEIRELARLISQITLTNVSRLLQLTLSPYSQRTPLLISKKWLRTLTIARGSLKFPPLL